MTIYVAQRQLKRSNYLNHELIYHTTESCPHLKNYESRQRQWLYQIDADHRECEKCKPTVAVDYTVPEGSHLESLLEEAKK